MVKCYLGITGSLCTEVADAVCAVADAFLGEFKERLGYDSVDIGACVDRNGVEPAEGFETGGEDVDLDIGADAVLVVEFVESLGDADAGVGEEDSLAVEVVYYARQVQVAAYGDVEVAESGHGYEALVASECGVHLITVGVTVEEVARVGILCTGTEGGGHKATEC